MTLRKLAAAAALVLVATPAFAAKWTRMVSLISTSYCRAIILAMK